MKRISSICLIGLTAILAGCGGLPVCDAPKPYHKAEPAPELDTPPGMTQPAPNPDFTIPGENEFVEQNPNYQMGGCLEVPPEVIERPIDEEGELIEKEESEEDE